MTTSALQPSHVPPPVLFWFRLYCGFMALIYLLCAPLFIILLQIDDAIPDDEVPFMIGVSIVWLVMCLVLLAAFLVPFFVEPKPWVWIFDLVLICIGLTSACFLIICVPLLIFWIKPETKAYFGR